MILLIDNYDSFSYNLYQLIGTVERDIKVVRNDECSLKDIEDMEPEALILSPGPGKPKDAGICIEAIRHFTGTVSYTHLDVYKRQTIDSGIFENLSKSDYLQAFEELNVIGQNMRRDDVIFREGDEVNKICIIDRGSVRGEKAYPNGELHIIQIYDEGSVCLLYTSF